MRGIHLGTLQLHRVYWTDKPATKRPKPKVKTWAWIEVRCPLNLPWSWL